MFTLVIFSLIIVILIDYSFSNPEYFKCKSYIPNKFNINCCHCKIFTNKVYFNNNVKLIHNLTTHCRDNEYLCGINSFLFEHFDYEQKNNYEDLMSKKTIEEIEKIKLKTKLITILIKFQNSFLDNFINDEKEKFLDNSINEEKEKEKEKEKFLDNSTNEEKEAYKLYCKKYIKKNLPYKKLK